MRLSLSFVSGQVSGEGVDDTGPFNVTGSYFGEGASLVKRYSTHGIHYDGKWDGSMLYGPWNQVGSTWNKGVFEMWPEGEDMAIESLFEQESDQLTHSH